MKKALIILLSLTIVGSRGSYNDNKGGQTIGHIWNFKTN